MIIIVNDECFAIIEINLFTRDENCTECIYYCFSEGGGREGEGEEKYEFLNVREHRERGGEGGP